MKKTGTINFLRFGNKFSHFIGDPSAPILKEVLTGLLTTVYKSGQPIIDELTADGVTADAIKAKLSELDRDRVKTLTTATETKSFQDGYKKAKKESLTEFETQAKEEHGITSDLTGTDLIKHIVAEKMKAAGATSEDEIRKTPYFQSMENKFKKDLLDAQTQADKKVKELETGFTKEKIYQEAGDVAEALIKSLNVVLPKSETVAATQLRDFRNEIKAYDIERTADGKFLVSKDGQLLKDAHGHTLSYEDHIKSIAANRFEFAVNNGGENSGAEKPKTDNNTGITYPKDITKPKNATELAEVLKKIAAPDGADEKIKKQIISQKRLVIETFQKENPGQ